MSGLAATALERRRLNGPIDVSLPPATITGLVGANGAGKTTLLRALAGLTAGTGDICLDGRSLADLSRDERARRLAYMPASREVEWPIAAADVVRLGLFAHGNADAGRIDRAMERTGTLGFASRAIDTLSTGERAMVLLARAIVGAPDVLLLDEPMANLDPLHRLDIESLLREEAARGAAVLLSIHDLDHAASLCDSIILMHGGTILACGTPAEVLTETNLVRAFAVTRRNGVWERACEPDVASL